jgi:hypothetical protein
MIRIKHPTGEDEGWIDLSLILAIPPVPNPIITWRDVNGVYRQSYVAKEDLHKLDELKGRP